ncbi:MAG TPA: glycosyltransferase family 39 protein [Thermoleophilaceae bacterium]|jgi:4-amino-4-deoxy-L-arabinose transferase-like glycosyltransferase
MADGGLSERAARVAGEPRPERRELLLVLVAAGLAVALRLAYVLITDDHQLAGDEPEYHKEGSFAADGKWLWTETFGVEHESMQKAPGYPVWVGVWYTLLGKNPDRVLAIQALMGFVPVGLTWLLGRRLFAPPVGLAAAFVVAVAPSAWQFDVRLYSEALATPLMLILLLVVLERGPSRGRVIAVGALLGVSLLIRPSAVFLFATVVATWAMVGGWRRGLLHSAAAVGLAVLIVVPWTLRNHSVDPDHLVPISIQDAALYGTFNDDAANDEKRPWAWRAVPASIDDIRSGPPLSDGEFRERLREKGFDYIREHPSSVPKAFFWNGVVRVWGLQRPERVIEPAPVDGRERTIATLAYISWTLMLPFTVAGLWLARRRRALVVPLLVTALAVSVVYTSDGGTRYRQPLEPVCAIFACSAAFAAAGALRRRRSAGSARPAAPSPA